QGTTTPSAARSSSNTPQCSKQPSDDRAAWAACRLAADQADKLQPCQRTRASFEAGSRRRGDSRARSGGSRRRTRFARSCRAPGLPGGDVCPGLVSPHSDGLWPRRSDLCHRDRRERRQHCAWDQEAACPPARAAVPAWAGLARPNALFISDEGRLERTVLSRGHLVSRKVLVSRLPFGEHQQDNLVFGRHGRLYLGSGSTCDACRERDPRSAAILSLRPDGRDLRVYASGLRNPYGLAIQPGTGRLYATVNGQDKLGSRSDPEPADTLVLVKRGARYGWPRCRADARTLRLAGRLHGITPPAAYFEPHSSADGLAFYTGKSFPRRHRGSLFVAEWGQYVSRRFGRRVVHIELWRDDCAC